MATTITQPMESQYCIKAGYHHRDSVIPFDDKTVPPFAWQNEVYAIARAIADAELSIYGVLGCVIDIGCGAAIKTEHFFGSENHGNPILIEDPEGPNWVEGKTRRFEDVAEMLLGGIVICADVIEHVADPHDFLSRILFCCPDLVILSTPARRPEHDGPPENTSHYREWSREEFYDFVSDVQSFVVHAAGHLSDMEYVIESHFISSVPNGTQTMVLRKL